MTETSSVAGELTTVQPAMFAEAMQVDSSLSHGKWLVVGFLPSANDLPANQAISREPFSLFLSLSLSLSRTRVFLILIECSTIVADWRQSERRLFIVGLWNLRREQPTVRLLNVPWNSTVSVAFHSSMGYYWPSFGVSYVFSALWAARRIRGPWKFRSRLNRLHLRRSAHVFARSASSFSREIFLPTEEPSRFEQLMSIVKMVFIRSE